MSNIRAPVSLTLHTRSHLHAPHPFTPTHVSFFHEPHRQPSAPKLLERKAAKLMTVYCTIGNAKQRKKDHEEYMKQVGQVCSWGARGRSICVSSGSYVFTEACMHGCSRVPISDVIVSATARKIGRNTAQREGDDGGAVRQVLLPLQPNFCSYLPRIPTETTSSAAIMSLHSALSLPCSSP